GPGRKKGARANRPASHARRPQLDGPDVAGSGAPGGGPRGEHGDRGDLGGGQVVPVKAGRAPLGFAFDHFVRRDDQVDAEVMLGLGHGIVDHLERVDGRRDHGAGADPPGVLAQGDRHVALARRPPPLFPANLPPPASSPRRSPSTAPCRAGRAAWSPAAASAGAAARPAGSTTKNGSSAASLGTATYSSFPSRSARSRTGCWARSGAALTTPAARHSARPASRSAAASAPAQARVE